MCRCGVRRHSSRDETEREDTGRGANAVQSLELRHCHLPEWWEGFIIRGNGGESPVASPTVFRLVVVVDAEACLVGEPPVRQANPQGQQQQQQQHVVHASANKQAGGRAVPGWVGGWVGREGIRRAMGQGADGTRLLCRAVRRSGRPLPYLDTPFTHPFIIVSACSSVEALACNSARNNTHATIQRYK